MELRRYAVFAFASTMTLVSACGGGDGSPSPVATAAATIPTAPNPSATPATSSAIPATSSAIPATPAPDESAVPVEPEETAPAYPGKPVPGVIEAEDFDEGGEGLGYHDLGIGNSGGAYRPDEDVDIVATFDPSGGGHDVNEFETGEWLAYTIEAQETADYDVALRLTSGAARSAFHIEVDGQDVTGRVDVPHTGSWTTYQWVSAGTISLTAGQHELKVISDAQYFDLNSLRIGSESAPATESAPFDRSELTFSCSFETSPTACGFSEQAKERGRATLVDHVSRDGKRAVRLQTRTTDTGVRGSGSAVRNDLTLNEAETGCYEGQEQWWAHSVYFPDDFIVPHDGWGLVLDFHQTDRGGGSTGQANFHVDTSRWDGQLRLRGYGGPEGVPRDSDKYEVALGPIVRNVWYDFVYHVRWSSKSDGFMEAWVNGEKVLDHHGPTLYTGQGCYLKLANYHTQVGAPSAVIHDRVRRGTTARAVAAGPLEGELEEINGVLTGVAE